MNSPSADTVSVHDSATNLALPSRPDGESSLPMVRAVAWSIVRLFRGVAHDVARLWLHKWWLVCIAGFTMVWAIELFLVQQTTLVSPQALWPGMARWGPPIRFLFDLCFCGGFALCLRRRWLFGLSVLAAIASLTLLTYHDYFQRPLSLMTTFKQWREAMSVGHYAVALVPWTAIVLVSLAFVAKCGLLLAARRPPFGYGFSLRLGAVFLAAYVAMFATADQVDPLSGCLTTRGIGRLGVMRGYIGPWLAEWYYLGSNGLERALKHAADVSDQLTPVEPTIPIGRHLAIIQVESLGFEAVDCQIHGQTVMPFLKHLREVSLFYRASTFHNNGSADADFVMLSGTRPLPDMLNYNIPLYPFDNALPRFLARSGFRTVALMADKGTFFNRRPNFERMGFADVMFREELANRYPVRPDYLGVRDSELLPISSLLFRADKQRECHFMATVTSHGPWDMLRDSEKELFPGSQNMAENYFNTLRYVDNTLRDYIGSLGRGTTIVIYGDHTAGVTYNDYHADRNGPTEYIPFWIYNVGEDLSALQRSRPSGLATDGSVSLLDLASFIRAQVARSYPQSDSVAKSDP